MLSRKAVLCVILLVVASTLVTIATAQTKGSSAPEKVVAIHAAYTLSLHDALPIYRKSVV